MPGSARTLDRTEQPTGAIVTTLDTFVDQCWDDHADDPVGVSLRLNEAIRLVGDDDGLARLAMLAHHVFGEHLGQWNDGLQFLAALSAIDIRGESGLASLKRCLASLQLCSGATDERAALSRGDACRATVMAACSLAPYDAARSSSLLQESVESASGFANDDPAVRSLASFSNNIAGTLQEKVNPSNAEMTLMLNAADIARATWERAGGWREVERAEYRVSVCQFAAGNFEEAFRHAKLCDSIVRDNGSEPLEMFFAAEALALAAKATNRGEAFVEALRMAESSFADIDPSDRTWCQPTLEKLRTCGQ